MSRLFSPTKIGSYQLNHRVALAPLTKMRSEPRNVTGKLMVEYYSQCATECGLLVSDVTAISPPAIAYVRPVRPTLAA